MAGLVFTSCSKDEDEEPQDLTPAITFQTGGDFITSDVTIDQGDAIKIGVVCTSNGISGKKLESFRIYMIINDATQPNIVDSTDIDATTFTTAYEITFPDVLSGKLYAEITDKDGQKKSVSFTVTVEEATTPLGAAEDLTWQRVAGAAGTGLDTFGLEWTSNGKAVNAQIEKADDGAEKFVLLTADEWDMIETIEDLTAKVEAGDDMDMYEGISAEATADYDEVLAVKYNEVYYIIHITKATVETSGSGTTITITGQYKI